MKRLQLSDEEVRHIEQRRMMENRENLGYNKALNDFLNWLVNFQEYDRDFPMTSEIDAWIEANKKVIRP